MELCQGDNTPSPKQPTKNIHLGVATRSSTKWKTPHHAASPKWPRQNNQVHKSAFTKTISKQQVWYINLRIKGDKYTPLTIFPDLGQAQIICGGVKLVSLDPNPPPIYGQR